MSGDDPKDKAKGDEGGSGSNTVLKLSDFDPLFLHSNDSNGTPLISFKLEGT